MLHPQETGELISALRRLPDLQIRRHHIIIRIGPKLRQEQVAATDVIGRRGVAVPVLAFDIAGPLATAEGHDVDERVREGLHHPLREAVAAVDVRAREARHVQSAVVRVLPGRLRHRVPPVVDGVARVARRRPHPAAVEEPVEARGHRALVRLLQRRVVREEVVRRPQVLERVVEHHLLVPGHGLASHVRRVLGEVHAVVVREVEERFQDVVAHRHVGLFQVRLGPLQVGGAVVVRVAHRDFLVVEIVRLQDQIRTASQVAHRVALLAARLDGVLIEVVRPDGVDAAGPDLVLADGRVGEVVALGQHGVAEPQHLIERCLLPGHQVHEPHGFSMLAAVALRPLVARVALARLQRRHEVVERLQLRVGDGAVEAVDFHLRTHCCTGEQEKTREGAAPGGEDAVAAHNGLGRGKYAVGDD